MAERQPIETYGRAPHNRLCNAWPILLFVLVDPFYTLLTYIHPCSPSIPDCIPSLHSCIRGIGERLDFFLPISLSAYIPPSLPPSVPPLHTIPSSDFDWHRASHSTFQPTTLLDRRKDWLMHLEGESRATLPASPTASLSASLSLPLSIPTTLPVSLPVSLPVFLPVSLPVSLDPCLSLPSLPPLGATPMTYCPKGVRWYHNPFTFSHRFIIDRFNLP